MEGRWNTRGFAYSSIKSVTTEVMDCGLISIEAVVVAIPKENLLRVKMRGIFVLLASIGTTSSVSKRIAAHI